MSIILNISIFGSKAQTTHADGGGRIPAYVCFYVHLHQTPPTTSPSGVFDVLLLRSSFVLSTSRKHQVDLRLNLDFRAVLVMEALSGPRERAKILLLLMLRLAKSDLGNTKWPVIYALCLFFFASILPKKLVQVGKGIVLVKYVCKMVGGCAEWTDGLGVFSNLFAISLFELR